MCDVSIEFYLLNGENLCCTPPARTSYTHTNEIEVAGEVFHVQRQHHQCESGGEKTNDMSKSDDIFFVVSLRALS